MSAGLLELRAVEKRFRSVDGSELQILSGVDLTVGEGERVSIVGRSGSGKSTLLNIIGLLDSASSGDVRFAGHDTARLSAPRRDRLRGGSIGFIFQQFNLLQGRSAADNVALPMLYDTSPAFWRRRKVATDMLERVGLGHRVDATPDKLSGGEQQRVAIARALVRSPRVILADEPTGALDVETGVVVMELLDEITASTGAAVITITHDAAVARRADRRYRLVDGTLRDADADAHPEPKTGHRADTRDRVHPEPDEDTTTTAHDDWGALDLFGDDDGERGA